MSLMKKLKLYDGEDGRGFTPKDVKELQDEALREGMDGISPRYVINRLSSALVRDGVTCINPIDALRALRDGLEQHTSIDREQREHLLNLIAEARTNTTRWPRVRCRKPLSTPSRSRPARCSTTTSTTSRPSATRPKLQRPDHRGRGRAGREADALDRGADRRLGEQQAPFREEILIRISSLARRGQKFDYTSHERLREAIEKKLFADLRDVVKITTSTKTPDAEQLRRINEVIDRLVSRSRLLPDLRQ